MSTLTGTGATPGAPDRTTADEWTVLVPVKALGLAKGRLAQALPGSGRRALVLAMASDVLAACSAAPGVSSVRVISSDPTVASLADDLGVDVFPDPSTPPGPGDEPLNVALAHALEDVAGPVGVVAADLPELTPSSLGRVLSAARGHAHASVPDHRGEGTTMAFWSGARASRIPRFGAGSAARFRSEGDAVPITDVDSSGVTRRDVDLPADLTALAGRPVGDATARALREHVGPLSAPTADVSATMVP